MCFKILHKKLLDSCCSNHEIGVYDLPALIDYVLNATGAESLFYVGHSQSTTTYFIMTSEAPEYNEKIRLSIMLAPVTYSSHIFNPIFRIGGDLIDIIRVRISKCEYIFKSPKLMLSNPIVI